VSSLTVQIPVQVRPRWGPLPCPRLTLRLAPTPWNWHWQHQAATKPHVRHKPRLLSDNGPSYIAGELAEWIRAQGMSMRAARPSIPRPKARSSASTRH
jgi:hypothetical protein